MACGNAVELPRGRWHPVRPISVLAGQPLAFEQALAVLLRLTMNCSTCSVPAFRVRKSYFCGRKVQLYFLMNAKSGLCPEDCGYCSQSKVSDAEIPAPNLLNREKLLDGVGVAAEQQAKTYCIVDFSPRADEAKCGPSPRSFRKSSRLWAEDLCLPGAADSRTSPRTEGLRRRSGESQSEHQRELLLGHLFHAYLPGPLVNTLHAVRDAGIELCSGGIIGWGRAMLTWCGWRSPRDLNVESIPVNFLNPIDGTPLAGSSRLNPRYCLKVLAMFRFANPSRELRIAGGRELHLGSLQASGLHPANSVFVGDYLTTKGQAPEADYRMIEDSASMRPARPEVAVGK